MMAIVLTVAAPAQRPQQPVTANLCEVVASPDGYNGKMLSVEGILLPGEHSVLLYSPSCKPKEGFDVGIQAVFPPDWVSSPNGKQLLKLFNQRTSASVKLIGTFESGTGRYGPDAAQFRFTISEISLVKKARTVGVLKSGAQVPSRAAIAAQECSPLSKPWVKVGNEQAPTGRKIGCDTDSDALLRQPEHSSARSRCATFEKQTSTC